jgi:uncharacterized cofD-like protein
MALSPIDIRAEVRGLDPAHPAALTTVRGQVELASTTGIISSVRMEPTGPPAWPEAVAVVRGADWVVLGPGSWYTSVIPHLLVPELRDALVGTRGRVVVNLNLAAQEGETGGYLPEDHLAALREHAPELPLHTVLADVSTVHDRPALEGAVASWGGRLVTADLAVGDGSARHDPDKLATALRRILEGGTGGTEGD